MGAVFRRAIPARPRRRPQLLPDSFSQDPDRVARFAREAQVLASLNHPNVATIYGLERLDQPRSSSWSWSTARRSRRGSRAGRSRRRRARLECIAEALDAAHERGIVHRDLKPSNVIVAARRHRQSAGFRSCEDADGRQPGIGAIGSADRDRRAATHAGSSSVRALHEPGAGAGSGVDRRTDIWASGCLLYEALTGAGRSTAHAVRHHRARPQERARLGADTRRNTLSAHRADQAVPAQGAATAYPVAGDVRLALEEMNVSESTGTVPPAASHAMADSSASAAVLFAGAVAAAVYSTRPSLSVVAATPVRVSVQLPPAVPLWFDDGVSLALSRDGRMVAWVGGSGSSRRLWVRAIDQLQSRALEGTEEASTPFFSPHGEWVAFFTTTESQVDQVAGGAPITIAASQRSRARRRLGRRRVHRVCVGIDLPLQRLPASGGTPLR